MVFSSYIINCTVTDETSQTENAFFHMAKFQNCVSFIFRVSLLQQGSIEEADLKSPSSQTKTPKLFGHLIAGNQASLM